MGRRGLAATIAVVSIMAGLAHASSAQAQRRPRPQRVIVLDETCGGGPPRTNPEWLITPADPCPGATLLRLCGGAARATCPTATAVAAELGDGGLDRCTADPALLSPAGELYEDYTDPG